VLAHNSVDRDLMARDSIELTQSEDFVASSRGKTRASSPFLRGSNQHSSINLEEATHPRASGAHDARGFQRDAESREAGARGLQRDSEPGSARGRARSRGIRNEDDSELIINPDELDLDDLDSEEAQFLRADRRVPVRRSPIPRKAASQLRIAGLIAAVVLGCGGLAAWTYSYGIHSWRFRIESSDAVEITGVHNASRAHVMEVAGADIGRNIFFVPLDERKRQLEQIPWVESASVMRLLPNRIAVTIQERTPVAFAQIGSRISLIDANGVVMGMPANRQIRYSFPVIRGISETEALSSRAAAMKIYNRLVGELSGDGAANGLASGAANGGVGYVRQLSEVDLSDPEDVKVMANDPGGTMVVHLGGQDFLARYKLYVAHIAEWRQQFQNLQSVDLRYEGQVVVNPDSRDRGIGTSGHRVIGTSGAAVAAKSPKPVVAKAKAVAKRR
jgi:cell division protein FtsQ